MSVLLCPFGMARAQNKNKEDHVSNPYLEDPEGSTGYEEEGEILNPIVAASNCLKNVMEVRPKDNLVIICDDSYKELGRIFEEGGQSLGLSTNLISLNDSEIRKEAPRELIDYLKETKVDLFINILRSTSEETPFRIEIVTTESARNVRLGHCPGLTKEMFTEGALAMSEEDYNKMNQLADTLLEQCERTRRVHVTCPAGTDLEMDVTDRPFFPDIRVNWESMKWMNLPVGEVMAGPVEDSLNGTLVCQYAIGGIGPIENKLVIKAEEGKAVDVKGDPDVVEKVERALDTDKMARYVGEFAMGVNHKARLVQEFLETEKTVGTSHIAFGNNTDFPGGENDSKNHMDFLMLKPTVEITRDDGEVILLKDGEFQI